MGTDYRLCYDSQWLTSAHLEGKEHKVKIVRAEAGELTGREGKTSKKLVLHFDGRKLPWAVPKTNAAALAKELGRDVDKWIGREIVLFPTMVLSFGEEVEAIRARVAK